jgi:hypothetical protein
VLRIIPNQSQIGQSIIRFCLMTAAPVSTFRHSIVMKIVRQERLASHFAVKSTLFGFGTAIAD